MTEFSPATLFFLEYFFPVRRLNNRRKVTALWDGLSQGKLTVKEAVALVPIETHIAGMTSQLFRYDSMENR